MKTILYLFVLFSTGLHFSQDKIDYSDEWRKGDPNDSGYDLRKTETTTAKIITFDLSNFWLNKERANEGILGETYHRIQFYITEALKCNDSIYEVKGKNKIKGLVSEFEGTIEVTTVFNKSFMDCDSEAAGATEDCNTLLVIGECRFEESSNQPSSGVFTGVMQTHLDYTPKTNTLTFNTGVTISDKYYQNNTFVGVWMSHKTGIEKKCVFGDFALPWIYLEDFRLYDGVVSKKYQKNGWEDFGIFGEPGYEVDRSDKWWE